MLMKRRYRLSNIETWIHAALSDFDQHHCDSGDFWIWNYVTNVYTAVFVSAGLVLAVGAYLLKERESDDWRFMNCLRTWNIGEKANSSSTISPALRQQISMISEESNVSGLVKMVAAK